VVKNGVGVKECVDMILSAWKGTEGYSLSRKRWEGGAVRGSGELPQPQGKMYRTKVLA